jgi:SAM-dependent methyltransferase
VTEADHLAATRAGYDAVAEQYAEKVRTELEDSPLDRAVLGGFAELVRRDHVDPVVLEVGSGPGDVAAHLHGLGLPVRGIDLSPAMVDLARRAHPEIDVEVGDMGDLDVADGTVAGVVAWYSFIHAPPARRPGVMAELHRVLRPGGLLLLAFQVGDDTLHLDEAFGIEVSLDFHRLRPEAVALLLEEVGFDVVARVDRAPEPTSAAAPIPQSRLIARKAG